MKIPSPLIPLIALIILVAGTLYIHHETYAGYTPWMTLNEMNEYLKPLGVKDAGGKNFWDHRHWLTGVQGRWHDGLPQYRLRIGDAPAKGPYWWWWWFNQDADSFRAHILDMSDKGSILVYWNSFKWPDGTVRYAGVWHRTKPDPSDAQAAASPSATLSTSAGDDASLQTRAQAALDKTGAAALAAKTPADLDGLLAELTALRDKSRTGLYDQNRQALARKLDGAVYFVSRWQDYLSALNSGDNNRAANYLRNATSTQYTPILPRSQILAMVDNLQNPPPAPAAAAPASPVLSVSGFDDLPRLADQLQASQRNGAGNMENMNAVNDVRMLARAWSDYNLGRDSMVLQDLQNTSNSIGPVSGLLRPLQQELLLKIAVHLAGIPDAPAPSPGQKPLDYLLGLAQRYKDAAQWRNLLSVLDAYRQLNGFGPVPAWLSGDLNGLNAFLAGQQQEKAGQIAEAMASYQQALSSVGKYFSTDAAGAKLAELQKKYPAVYKNTSGFGTPAFRNPVILN